MTDQRPPVEPRADVRQGAQELRQLYVALINEQFTEQQALTIIGQILATTRGEGRG